MIKVLFIIDQLLRGGAERLLLDLLPRLREHGIEPTLCVLGRDLKMLPDFKAAGLEPILLQMGKWTPAVVGKLTSLIRNRDIDLVNAHLGKAILAGWLAARSTGVPFVAHDHVGPSWPHLGGGFPSRVQNLFMCHATEWCMEKAAAVIVVSELSRQWLGKRHPHLAEKVTTITNGIDLESLQKVRSERDQHRLDVRREFGLPESSTVILYVASFRAVKGWDVFVDVAERVCKAHPDVHFIGGGEGPKHQTILADVEQRCLSARIHLPGSRSDVPRLMAAADIFLMPTEMESDGIVAKEAMAMALPIVASDIPMLSNKVQHGKSGFLVPVGDVANMAEACQNLLSDPLLRASCSNAALASALQQFDIGTCVEKVQKVFHCVVKSPKH